MQELVTENHSGFQVHFLNLLCGQEIGTLYLFWRQTEKRENRVGGSQSRAFLFPYPMERASGGDLLAWDNATEKVNMYGNVLCRSTTYNTTTSPILKVKSNNVKRLPITLATLSSLGMHEPGMERRQKSGKRGGSSLRRGSCCWVSTGSAADLSSLGPPAETKDKTMRRPAGLLSPTQPGPFSRLMGSSLVCRGSLSIRISIRNHYIRLLDVSTNAEPRRLVPTQGRAVAPVLASSPHEAPNVVRNPSNFLMDH